MKNHTKPYPGLQIVTLIEVIKLGLPHRRQSDKYVYFVPHVGGVGYSQADVMADDWVSCPGVTPIDWTKVVDFTVKRLEKIEKSKNTEEFEE